MSEVQPMLKVVSACAVLCSPSPCWTRPPCTHAHHCGLERNFLDEYLDFDALFTSFMQIEYWFAKVQNNPRSCDH